MLKRRQIMMNSMRSSVNFKNIHSEQSQISYAASNSPDHISQEHLPRKKGSLSRIKVKGVLNKLMMSANQDIEQVYQEQHRSHKTVRFSTKFSGRTPKDTID